MILNISAQIVCSAVVVPSAFLLLRCHANLLGIKEEDVSSPRVLLVLLTLFASVVAVQGCLDENAVSEGLGLCGEMPCGGRTYGKH